MANKLLATYKNWVKYRETYSELNRLSNRELTDLGINRGEINLVAKRAVGF